MNGRQIPENAEEALAMCILVVDDAEDGKDIFTAVLAKGGYNEVVALDSAATAFSFLGLETSRDTTMPPVKLELLDVVMPEVTGMQACARIRSDPRYANLPIVLTTALDDVESMENAFKSGATDYLTKPLKVVDLLACLHSNYKLSIELDRRNGLERELIQHAPFHFD